MKTVDNYDFHDKKALVRVDFNVSWDDNFKIIDDSRISAAIPTILKIIGDGGSVILMSHKGRPKKGPECKYSLRHIVDHLSQLLKTEVKFADDCIGKSAKLMAKKLKPGDVLLLENLRFYKEETDGNRGFAKKLASLGDVFVNDAFGVAHRAHASNSVIAEFFKDKMFGYLIEHEIESIDKIVGDIKRPFVGIIGGAKVSTKIGILNSLIDRVDDLIIGGGMMFTFIKALGGKVGNSLVEDDYLSVAKETISYAESIGVNIHLPVDAIIADKFSNDANIKSSDCFKIPDNWMGLDIGEKSIKKFSSIIEKSKNVLWNGPMGVTEMPNFAIGTEAILKSLVKATKEGSFTLVGGGDSVAIINKFKLSSEVSYVSTGGGALLEYIKGKELPGIKAITQG